jgi:hypothetical protein
VINYRPLPLLNPTFAHYYSHRIKILEHLKILKKVTCPHNSRRTILFFLFSIYHVAYIKASNVICCVNNNILMKNFYQRCVLFTLNHTGAPQSVCNNKMTSHFSIQIFNNNKTLRVALGIPLRAFGTNQLSCTTRPTAIQDIYICIIATSGNTFSVIHIFYLKHHSEGQIKI